MTSTEIVQFIVIPLSIFFLTAVGGGIVGLVKLTVHFTKSREAQEATAKSNEQIARDLHDFMEMVREQLMEHAERISVLESLNGFGGRFRR